jgi:hypothetical protein
LNVNIYYIYIASSLSYYYRGETIRKGGAAKR